MALISSEGSSRLWRPAYMRMPRSMNPTPIGAAALAKCADEGYLLLSRSHYPCRKSCPSIKHRWSYKLLARSSATVLMHSASTTSFLCREMEISCSFSACRRAALLSRADFMALYFSWAKRATSSFSFVSSRTMS
ncbi:hypothetical protein ACP275_10G102500 [Erythranthe tilingii]